MVFFASSRGLNQEDPLSSIIFIIMAEVLSRGLNALFDDPRYEGYGLPKWSPNINHLAYEDDTILFCLRDRYSVIQMMKVIRRYEVESGELVNKVKSFYYLHDRTPLILSIRLRKLTCIKQGSFPFTYLGCPIYYERKKICYFEDLIRKVARKVLSWQSKLLSFGGRMVLKNHVLQSLSVYLLAIMNPLKEVIKCLHKIFTRFFWCKIGGAKVKY